MVGRVVQAVRHLTINGKQCWPCLISGQAAQMDCSCSEHRSAFLHSIVWSDCPLVWLHEGPPHVLLIAYTIWQRDVQIALLLAAGEVSGAVDAQGECLRLVL